MKVQYIYTIEIPDEKVPELQESAERFLCAEMDKADRIIAMQVMGQVVEQTKAAMQRTIGTPNAAGVIIQHCCVLGMAAGGEYSIRFRVLPEEGKTVPSMNIVWN